MKTIMNKLSANKALSATLLVTLTILYLLGTAAFAQNSSLPATDNVFSLSYTRDQLSFGDLWMFDEALYNQSAYAGPAVNLGTSANQLQYYANQTSSEKSTFVFEKYFSKLQLNDHAAPSGDTISVMTFDKFHASYTASSVKGLNGANITTMIPEKGMIARYTTIPGSTGSYRVYVYSQEEPTGSVGIWVLDSATGNNDLYDNKNVEYPTFTQAAPDSQWWYATIQVDATGWTGAYPGNSTQNTIVDKGTTKSDEYQSGQNANSTILTDTLLNGGGDGDGTTAVPQEEAYYNKWNYSVVKFNTLITIEWSGEIQLGTIVREIDIELNGKTNTDDYKGTTVLTDVFGERFEVADGVLTKKMARVPFEIVATPDDKEVSVLDAIEGVTNCVLEEGWYTPGNVEILVIGLRWTRFIPMPDVCVSYDDKFWNGDFYAKNGIGVPADMNNSGTYQVTLDFSKCSADDITGVDYVVMQVGIVDPIDSGTLVAGSASFSVPVAGDNITVILTTKGTEVTRTCTISFLPGVPGLDQNVKNLTTGVTYQFIEDALEAANFGDTIMLLGDVSFRETGRKNSWGSPTDGGAGYTVKSGVTLLLPYSQEATTIGKVNDEDEKFPYANYALTYGTYVDLDPFAKETLTLTLTVPTGITVYNEGVISVGGMVDGDSKQGYGGVPTGAHANLALNGQLNMRSTGVLSVVGYIVGDGTVNANASGGGAKIYQLFSIMDFRGGTYCLAASGKTTLTSPVATQSDEALITPFNRFAFLGIQSTLVITKGNHMYGYCDLRANKTDNQTNILFIGTDPTASLLALTADNAVLTITYDPDTHLESFYNSDVLLPYDKIGKTTVAISGNAELGYMTLSLEVMTGVGVNMGTNSATFNIPYNYAIELTNGTFSISNDMALLPGASLTVGENAQVNVAKRLHVYTGLVDARTVSSSKSVTSAHDSWHITAYPSTTELQCDSFGGNGMGNLIVDGGTLELKSGAKFSGLVQTTGSGTLKVNSGANVSGSSTYHQFGATGEVHVDLLLAKFDAYVAGSCVFTDGGRIVDPATGAITQLAANKTYTAYSYTSSLGSYSYTMYTNSADTSTAGQIVYTEALGATVQGAWYEGSTTAGKLDSETNAVAKVENDQGKLEYYSSLQAAISAAADGDTVTLLKSITLNQPVASKASITLDLNGKAVTCPNGLMVNSSTMTLVLGDSTITEGVTTPNIQDETASDTVQSINVPCITNLAGATLTVDMGTAAIHWGNGTEFDLKTTVIANYGTMTISGNGSITMSDYTTGTVARTGYSIQFASVVHNAGTLTISTTLLNMTQQTNENSSVIINHKGTIELLSNATITHNNGYGLYNLGGTVTSIFGGTIKGQYGIKNQNITGGKNTVDNGLFVTHEAKIGTIQNTNVTVTSKYCLLNYATVGTIGGTSSFTAPSLAIYNTGNWYYDTAAYKVVTINGVKHTYYDRDRQPTIDLITDNVSITVTGSKVYAIQNEGYIGTINGNVKIIAGSITDAEAGTYTYTGYGLNISNGGYVGTLGGNVSITTYGNALVLSGQGATLTRSWTTAEDAEGKYQVYSVTVYEKPSRLNEIVGDTTGSGVVIETSGADYAISNAGAIGSISGKVTLTSGYRGALYNNLAPAYAKYTYIRYYDANGTEYQRDWNYDFNYENASCIGSIGGNEGDAISISSSRYGIYNCGYIGLVGKGVTVSVKGNYGAIYNYPERRLSRYGIGTWETLTGYEDDSAEGKIQTTVHWTYTCDAKNYPSTIEIINGATIKNTKNYAINNSGYIGVITNCTISAANSAIYNNPTGPYDGELKKVACYTHSSVSTSTSYDNVAETILSSRSEPSGIGVIDNCTITASTRYAINNCGHIGYIQKSTISAKADTVYQGDASTMSYEVTDEEYLVRGTTGKYAFISSPTKQYTYQLAEINTIGAGNTIKSTNSSTVGPAIANSGIIDTINGNVQVSWTVTDGVVSAFTEQEATNKPTLILSSYSSGINNYGGHETSTAATSFESARIGTIKNVSIVGKTYGIVNGDGTSSSYTVTIGEIGEGVVAVATADTGYGLYNADQYATITLISGGDYYSGAKVRDNAIYQPDKQSYLTDCHALSTETRKVTANGKEYACYYIVATHTWKDCACEDCKIMKFYATNVRMGNSLDILFAFPKSLFPDGMDWSGYYAEFTRVGRDPMKIYFSDWDTMMIGKVECYVVTYNGFAAKEMGDSVAVSLYDASGNRISLSKTDSIQAYAMRMLNKNSGNKTLQTAIVDMLNYGAACQNHFSYRVDSLANALLSDAQKDYATASPKDVADVDEQLAVAREKSKAYFKSNLVTDSNIKFTMAFHKGMFTEITYKFIGHKNNEVETTVTADEMTASGNYLLYSIPELVVADARCTIEVTVTLANGNTETWGESIEAYIARNATYEDGDVYYAFMTFADSAEAYLHSEEVVK